MAEERRIKGQRKKGRSVEPGRDKDRSGVAQEGRQTELNRRAERGFRTRGAM